MKNKFNRFLGRAAFTFIAALLTTPSALAYKPLRTVDGLLSPVKEVVKRVPGARVVLADYGLLRRDFAETRAMSDAQVDKWLLSKTAFMSQAQIAQTQVNSQIEATDESTIAYRPEGYGRALVYQTGNGGLIDGKGTGVAKEVRTGGHGDGLATLGEATREFLYEKLVRTVLGHSGSRFETIEHYAVIDWGFDVIHDDGSTSPAGMVLRQAHKRMNTDASLLDDASSREVEMTLRRYGLTSAGAYRNDGATQDKINVQGSPDGGLLDFGGYTSEESFDRPAAHFDHPGNILLSPDQVDFVQPEPTIRVSLQNWGHTVTGIDDPKLDNPYIWSHELARDYRAGTATRESFKAHFDNLVGGYRRQLFMLGGETGASLMETLVRSMHDIH